MTSKKKPKIDDSQNFNTHYPTDPVQDTIFTSLMKSLANRIPA